MFTGTGNYYNLTFLFSCGDAGNFTEELIQVQNNNFTYCLDSLYGRRKPLGSATLAWPSAAVQELCALVETAAHAVTAGAAAGSAVTETG